MRRAVIALLLAACELNPAFQPDLVASGSAGSGINPDEAAIQVANLRASWGTPNVVRWDWDTQGEPDLLLRYELVVGLTEDDVRTRSASAVVWGPDQNPELGRYQLPRTEGVDVVTFTMTDQLEPDTPYFAQLEAFDTAGNSMTTNVASGRTGLPPIDEIVVFADEDTPGYSLPDTFVLSTDKPYAGPAAYRYESICSGEADCWENLRRQEMGIALDAISRGSFDTTAFLEIAVAVDATSTPWWCNLWLSYDGTSERLTNYDAWTARPDGEYRLMQVPLRAFRLGEAEEPTPFTELANGLDGFNVGGPWPDGAVIHVDEIRIRW